MKKKPKLAIIFSFLTFWLIGAILIPAFLDVSVKDSVNQDPEQNSIFPQQDLIVGHQAIFESSDINLTIWFLPAISFQGNIYFDFYASKNYSFQMYLINLNNNSMVTPNQLLELNVTSGHSLLELTLGVDFFVGPGEYPLVLTMTPAKDSPNNSSFFIVSSFSFTIIFGPVLTITSLIFFLLGFLFIMLEREVITTLPFVNQPLRHPHPRKSMRGQCYTLNSKYVSFRYSVRFN